MRRKWTKWEILAIEAISKLRTKSNLSQRKSTTKIPRKILISMAQMFLRPKRKSSKLRWSLVGVSECPKTTSKICQNSRLKRETAPKTSRFPYRRSLRCRNWSRLHLLVAAQRTQTALSSKRRRTMTTWWTTLPKMNNSQTRAPSLQPRKVCCLARTRVLLKLSRQGTTPMLLFWILRTSFTSLFLRLRLLIRI